ncbi:Crp/Fnr family transcriptional regulator [Chitinivibrio alkaliphilus]|uniref:Putative transcriptional regulator, Crp/Fnr family n=1 Tax=Chitinivibrio alkaliphilus ACht1 TaxID=1313304 RepID=U7D9Y1_9BACT|nr:Crp/Fnr family transcriptional regulator [Chitinivibrio alkaliphilus]ERP39214.1 putative transcriptional regulator, Crp/Fnr family [Chitinivibrio alkaliphilus ACht1]
MPVDKLEVLRLLQDISIFGAVPPAALDKILYYSEEISLQKGEILFCEGDPSHAIYIILRGRVKLVKNYAHTPLEMVELSPGDSMGEASFIGIQAHGTTAVITEKATLLVLTRQVLSSLYENDIELFTLLLLNMSRELARRLHRCSEYLRDLETRD